MVISPYNRNRISVLSLILIVMVVYIHSYYLEGEKYTVSDAFQKLGGGLASLAVPFFYLISGMLFFNNINYAVDCIPKIKKRMRTLLIPYLIWNLIFVLWYLVLSYMPGISSYVNSDILSDIDFRHPLDVSYCLFVKPAGFHLWFLRDLIVFVLVSPILYLFIKRWKWTALLITFVATGWMARFWLTYFVLGGIIALHCDVNGKYPYFERMAIPFLLTYVVLILCDIFFHGMLSDIFFNYLSQITVLFGIIGLWFVFDRLKIGFNSKGMRLLIGLSGFSFFIYLFHEPVFNIIKKLALRVFGESELSLCLLYVINPILLVSVAIAVGIFARKFVPRAFGVIVGGR